jgi:choline-sulfatase
VTGARDRSTGARPDILILQADQLAPHFLAAYGHRVTLTPYLSELAGSGAVFDAAYCNSPLCAPSRASMLTGRMPSEIGAYDNATPISSALPTFAHYLRAGGYRTALAGKMHFIGPDQMHGFEERLSTDIYPADLGWTPDWDDPEGDPMVYYLRMAADELAGAGLSPERTWQMRYDDEVAGRAVRWLRDAGDRDRPFLLTVSFTHPHDPFRITGEYWDRYRGRPIDDPVAPEPPDPVDDPTLRLREIFGLDRLAIDGSQVRAARRAYYGEISYLDDNIGRVLAALRAANRNRPTIIIFVSDHGEMLGERGLWFKMSFFERSARVPLIVNGPGIAATRVREPVSLLDLLPTLLDAAGLDPDVADTPGQSLLRLAGGAVPDGSRPVYGEFLGEGLTEPMVMIRDGRFKYIAMRGAPALLFDVVADPEERVNLFGTGRAAGVAERLAGIAEARWDLTALRELVVASQRERRLVHRALTTGTHVPWDYPTTGEPPDSYVRNV